MIDEPNKHRPIRELPPDEPDSQAPRPDDAADPAAAHERLDGRPSDADAAPQADLGDSLDAGAAATAREDSDTNENDPITMLERSCAEMEAKYLRAAADLQNYVRRTQQNVADARQQQLMDVAKSLVLVLDHFDHALEVDPASTSPDALLAGVQIVRDELLGALERFGVKRLEVKQGDEFDPHRHEALMRQAVEGLGPDRIAVQFKPGYTLEDKTLRPAQVSVTE